MLVQLTNHDKVRPHDALEVSTFDSGKPDERDRQPVQPNQEIEDNLYVNSEANKFLRGSGLSGRAGVWPEHQHRDRHWAERKVGRTEDDAPTR